MNFRQGNNVKTSLIAMLAGLLVSGIAMAAPTAKDAETLIVDSSNQINAIVKDASGYIESDPERYYAQIATVLDPVVDFTTFARGVMGYTASERYVKGLPEAEREAARAYVPQFRDVLHHTLMKSYGKIFYNYAGSTFTIKSSELLGKGDRASVIQKVVDPQSNQYALQYTLNAAGGNGWKIQNVIVDGVNMGQSYRAQFEAALEKYKGSVPDVIKNWPEIMQGHE
jgi:phospholipid transport system substrate-binding protein